MIKNHLSVKVINIAFILSIAVMSFIVGYYYKQGKAQFNGKEPFTALNLYRGKAAIGAAEVSITQTSFSPETISINKGWQVTWTNTDEVPRRISTTSETDNWSFDSEPLAPGESFSVTFPEAGTYVYHDSEDPINIVGTVIVKPY